jgi:hypothetical protein
VNQVLVTPTITSQPADQTVALGGTAIFSVSATGTAPLSYQWQFNGADLPNQTNSSLILLNTSPANQGTYLVRVENVEGFTNSQSASLIVLTPSASFVAYTASNVVYSQNFDSLPNPGINSVNADNPVKVNGITYGLANPFDFTFPILPNSVDPLTGIGLGGLGLSNSMSGWYAMGQSGSKFGASAGDQSTGGAISFGLTGNLNASTNRALGLLATSSTGQTAFGLKLVNETDVTLNQITVGFTGELWRQAAVSKPLLVSYLVDPTGTNSFSTNASARLPKLDVVFASDLTATNAVAVDGTALSNQISLSVTNRPIADWTPGAALWLIWQMTDPAGKGQGLAIDDLLFSASKGETIAVPELSIRQQGLEVIVSWPVAFSGYQLEGNSDLGAAVGWTTIPQPVNATNGINSVAIPIGTAAQYYRLKK